MRVSHAPNGPSPRQLASERYAVTNASWAASSASCRSPRIRWQARTTGADFALDEEAEGVAVAGEDGIDRRAVTGS